MEESKEIQKLYSFLQGIIYLLILIEVLLFVFNDNSPFPLWINDILSRIDKIVIYRNVYYSKTFILLFISVVSTGTRARKKLELKPYLHIGLPLILGLFAFFGSGILTWYESETVLFRWRTASAISLIDLFDILYMVLSFIGAVLIHTSLDNVSKIIKSNLMKDRWNDENESFDQNRVLKENDYSINIPILFYFGKKLQKGWMNIVNPFRGTLLIGTPGSGKTFSIILPFIKQLLGKGFSCFVYDFKYPDLGKVTYYHYLVNRKKGLLKDHSFHVINLNDIEYSRRINPLDPKYIKSLADATETADALLQALRKVDSSTGTDQFFTQSAVNMLSCVIYFLSRYEQGRYSTFAHVLSLLNRNYDELFRVLYSEPELESLLSPFRSAHEKKAYEQLEGQLGTLKINISRLATKETYWVFSGDDFNLKISDPTDPSILVVANDPDTQEINSACYSLVLNRLTKLINKKGNLPSSIIVDEVPTLYIHRVENLIATARSNKVAVLLGLQELTQFRQQYGKQTADTICSVVANIISGQVRNKETLDWLEKLFGKVKQMKTAMSIDRSRTSINMSEQMDNLIPASKIGGLQSGQVVAQLAQEAADFDGRYRLSNYNCKVNLDLDQIEKEEKRYVELPKFYNFGSLENKNGILRKNMQRIKAEVQYIIDSHN